MRFRKSRGKKKATVTLSENEILQACYDYVEKNGLETGKISYIKIPIRYQSDGSLKEKPSKKRIEVSIELEEQKEKESFRNLSGNYID